MPHGGGHSGGGGGGGGGSHGLNRKSNYHACRCNKKECCATALLVAMLMLILPVTLTYQYHATSMSLVLSPEDTRLVSRSSVLCQGMTISSNVMTVNSTVYRLQSFPKLNAINSFVLSANASIVNKGDYEYWSFHLYPGSNYSLSACLRSGSSVKYYTLKGTSDYNSWVNHPSSIFLDLSPLRLTNKCGTSNNNNIATSQAFSSEDDYYFVFCNDGTESANVQVKFSFHRTDYSPKSGGIISTCTTTSESDCSVDLPYNSDPIVLIQTGSPSDGDWGTNVNIVTSCALRAWVFVVIEISALVAVGLCTPIVLLWMFFLKQKKTTERPKRKRKWKGWIFSIEIDRKCFRSLLGVVYTRRGNAALTTRVIPPLHSIPQAYHETTLSFQTSTVPKHSKYSASTANESRTVPDLDPHSKQMEDTAATLPPDYASGILAPSAPPDDVPPPDYNSDEDDLISYI